MSFGTSSRSERYGACDDDARTVRSVKGIFREAHVPAKNNSECFASADANSARLLGENYSGPHLQTRGCGPQTKS